jgi:hypothetical protein
VLLEALAEQRQALILAGAHAVDMHTGERDHHRGAVCY